MTTRKQPKIYRSPRELRRAFMHALLNLDFTGGTAAQLHEVFRGSGAATPANTRRKAVRYHQGREVAV